MSLTKLGMVDHNYLTEGNGVGLHTLLIMRDNLGLELSFISTLHPPHLLSRAGTEVELKTFSLHTEYAIWLFGFVLHGLCSIYSPSLRCSIL